MKSDIVPKCSNCDKIWPTDGRHTTFRGDVVCSDCYVKLHRKKRAR